MIVICKSNKLSELSNFEKISKFAFDQESDSVVQLTIGDEYLVYGVRKNNLGEFYLVVRDNESLPWWMPVGLFTVKVSKVPVSWSVDRWTGYGKETVKSNSIYFDAYEDIEDGTPIGYETFAKMKQEVEDMHAK